MRSECGRVASAWQRVVNRASQKRAKLNGHAMASRCDPMRGNWPLGITYETRKLSLLRDSNGVRATVRPNKENVRAHRHEAAIIGIALA